MLRQSIYSWLAGYEGVNDAERLSQDPAFRLIGSQKVWERGAALDLPLTVIRDGTADAGKQPRLYGRAQSGAGRQGPKPSIRPDG